MNQGQFIVNMQGILLKLERATRASNNVGLQNSTQPVHGYAGRGELPVELGDGGRRRYAHRAMEKDDGKAQRMNDYWDGVWVAIFCAALFILLNFLPGLL
jgi:hypothetical protein